MGFKEMEFDPKDGLRNPGYHTTPSSEDAAREQIQGRLDELRDHINNQLYSELESIVPEESGADKIGSAAINGITYFDENQVEHNAVTVYKQIESLKKQLNQAVTEGFGNGDITRSMIADSAIDDAKLAKNTVETDHIKDYQVDNSKLAGNSISHEKIQEDAVRENHIQQNAVTSSKIVNGAVVAGKIGLNAVTEAEIANGEVTQSKLGTIQSITLDSGDTVTYDAPNNLLKLNVNGCTSVQLAPIVFGTSMSPPAGTFPKGTLYLTYEV